MSITCRELKNNPLDKIVLVAHGSDREIFLDEIVIEQQVETQDPLIGGEALLNDERGAYLVNTSERSATHQLRAIQSQLSSLKASLLSLQERVVALKSKTS